LARRILAAVPRPPSHLVRALDGHVESRIAVVRLGPPIDVAVFRAEFMPSGGYTVLHSAYPPSPSAFSLGFEWPGSDTEVPAWLATARVAMRDRPTAELATVADEFLKLGASRT